MATDFDPEITKCETTIEQTRQQMETQCGVLYDAITAMANPWYETHFKSALQAQPARIVALGDGGLTALKSDFNLFLKRTRFEVESLAMSRKEENFSHFFDYKADPNTVSTLSQWRENAYMVPPKQPGMAVGIPSNFPFAATLTLVGRRLSELLAQHKLQGSHQIHQPIPWSEDFLVALEGLNRLHNKQLKAQKERDSWIQKKTEAKAKELLGKVFN